MYGGHDNRQSQKGKHSMSLRNYFSQYDSPDGNPTSLNASSKTNEPPFRDSSPDSEPKALKCQLLLDSPGPVNVPDPSNSSTKNKEKGKRLSLKDQTIRDLNFEFISQQLKTLQSTIVPCCVLACFSWLTVAIVLGCRSQYLGLPTHKERHAWLDQKLEEMKKRTKSSQPYSETFRYDYVIDCFGYEEKRCCSHFGDPLPCADRPTVTEIRVPQAKKKMVWESFLKYFARDVTNTSKPIAYDDAVSTWKYRKDLSHIKCAKYKEGFSKCEVCAQYEDDAAKQLSENERATLDAEVIKVSYLIVGHTHEDIDSYFSALSRYFKYILQKIKTVSAFLTALMSWTQQIPIVNLRSSCTASLL